MWGAAPVLAGRNPTRPRPRMITCSNSRTISGSRREGIHDKGRDAEKRCDSARERTVWNDSPARISKQSEPSGLLVLGSSLLPQLTYHLGVATNISDQSYGPSYILVRPWKSCLRSQDLVLEKLYYHTRLKADHRTDPQLHMEEGKRLCMTNYSSRACNRTLSACGDRKHGVSSRATEA